MLPCYVVLDLETTGGSAQHDRITEIAAVRMHNGREVARWSSLVNPGVPISAYIENLTGINDAMVAKAPAFATVLPPLLALLDGAVLVAHNVRFDHGFLLSACERAGHQLRVPTLCTVHLSRRLYPQHKGHGLDAIMHRHGLTTQARHRAMGDVEMLLAWLACATSELGAARISAEAHGLLQVGPRPAVRKAALSLGGQLLQALGPSAASAPSRRNCAWYLAGDAKPHPQLRLLRATDHDNVEARRIYGPFRSRNQALLTLRTLAHSHHLCLKALGLESGKGGCSAFDAGHCRGLCCGHESATTHHQRLQLALTPHRLRPWPHPGPIGLRDYNPDTERTELHVLDQWCFVATVHDEEALDATLHARHKLRFNLSIYLLLCKHLAVHKLERVALCWPEGLDPVWPS